MSYSSVEEFNDAFYTLKKTFASGKTKDKEWRRVQLRKVWWMLEDNKEKILAALRTDLNKHRHEALTSDFGVLQVDVLHTLKNLDKWTADERPAKMNPINFLGKATVRKEPLGTTLIIGAWNYPFLLTLQPMVAAIAAGCTIIIKPSDVAVASQDVMKEIITKYLDQSAIRVITAGPKEMGYILEQRFNHIFYTGSPNIAKIINVAAAKHLTPVTLELGGQGPAIVCESADIDLAAKRIAATKFNNAGQICLNVNHVFVHPKVRDEFLTALNKYFAIFLGGAEKRPSYYSTIINRRNFDRLDTLLNATSGRIVFGGDRDPETLYFGPTVIRDVKMDDSTMTEELFGPILPVIDADLRTAINLTASGEHPLALYAFTNNAREKERILNETLSGGVTFNDTVMHIAAEDAPFGGVGTSGQGNYHGHYGVLAFSHLRSYIDLPNWLEKALAARYPPYTNKNADLMLKFLGGGKKNPGFDREGRKTGLFC